MSNAPESDITAILQRWSNGDRAALDQLTPLVYSELLRMAQARLHRERAGHSLETKDLVHEAYLRMVDQTGPQWRDRVHFFAVSSQIIRHILVDHARARHRDRRGGGVTLLTLNESIDGTPQRSMDVIALDDALKDLARLDARQSRVVELRFFGGLEIEEVAEVLGVSRATVNRDWVTARAWLLRQLANR
jgi:RNA polymerase sigma factor (TIGR02999 family)